ncbi:MAG: HAD hydrolase-like protein [Deltaproteobacteria bacterium]|nr:HAD hydrolase-like protein [Deltaproteobacteria bacterium]
MNKKIIVFDFDGTLVDSMGHLADIAAEVMSLHFSVSRERARDLYHQTSGLPFSEQLKSLYPDQPEKTKMVSDVFETKKRENYFSEPIFPDTLPTLLYLKAKGYTVIVSSNSAQDLLDRFVKQLELPCDLVLGHKGDFAKGLPHFLHIMKRWGVPALEMVFVGDSIKDGEWAFESHIDFIGKEGMFTRAQFQKRFPGIPVLSKLAQLKEMF